MRTDEDKILQNPVTVFFNGVEYGIKPLVIREAREWRRQFAALIGKLPSYTKTTTDDPAGFNSAVGALIVEMPDEMTDLFFSYAKDLPRDEIEGTATELEMAAAVEVLLTIAIPLLPSLTKALGKMAG